MSETPTQPHPTGPEAPKPFDFFNLPPAERTLREIQLVNQMEIVGLKPDAWPAFPIVLQGYAEQVAAFLDLVYRKTPPSTLGVIISGESETQVLAEASLAYQLQQNGGNLFVTGRTRETTIVYIEKNPQTGAYLCGFGYSAIGSSVERYYNGQIFQILISLHDHADNITDQSLCRLFQLTANHSYNEFLRIRTEMRSDNGTSPIEANIIDPNGYYAILGLDPYALRFMSAKNFLAIVKAIRTGLTRTQHPDVAILSKEDYEHYMKILEASSVLLDEDRCREYSKWID